jgi:hypothetical protein
MKRRLQLAIKQNKDGSYKVIQDECPVITFSTAVVTLHLAFAGAVFSAHEWGSDSLKNYLFLSKNEKNEGWRYKDGSLINSIVIK